MAKESRRRDDDDEDEDDKPRARRRDDDDDEADDDDDARPGKRPAPRKKGNYSGVIPYKNGSALAAYYCGVFGLIPGLGFLLGPIAGILGILGIVKARSMPESKGTGHAIAGIVLGIIDVILWPILWVVFLGEIMK